MDQLLIWQRLARREAHALFDRALRTDRPMLVTQIPGAELLCPACSSEARPDEDDTATCGSCGTLSPLDSTVAYSNFIHQTLHSGIRARVAMHQGHGGDRIPPMHRPFPSILVRVGSLFVLAAVSGMRRSQLDELLTAQKSLLQRWVKKEIEEGDRRLVSDIPPSATGVEIAQTVLNNTLGPLPNGFPNNETLDFTLEQVFLAAAQYYKFRTTSTYVAFLVDGLADGLRAKGEYDHGAPIPWKDASRIARALDPDARGEHVLDHYRGSEEALAKATIDYLTNEIRLVRTVFGRHRIAQQALA